MVNNDNTLGLEKLFYKKALECNEYLYCNFNFVKDFAKHLKAIL